MDEAEKRARGFMLWARVQYSEVEKGRMALGAFLDLVEFRLGQYFRENSPKTSLEPRRGSLSPVLSPTPGQVPETNLSQMAGRSPSPRSG